MRHWVSFSQIAFGILSVVLCIHDVISTRPITFICILIYIIYVLIYKVPVRGLHCLRPCKRTTGQTSYTQNKKFLSFQKLQVTGLCLSCILFHHPHPNGQGSLLIPKYLPGIVPSSVVLTAFQVMSRVFLTWAVTHSVKEVS